MPQTMRSGFVGISLRWRLSSAPSGPMTTTVLNSVVPLNWLSSSLHADHHGYAVPGGRILDRLQIPARKIDGVLAQPRMDFARKSHVAARPQAPDPGRITGDISLGKYQQRCAVAGRLVHRRERGLDRLCAVEQNRRLLDDGDFGHEAP